MISLRDMGARSQEAPSRVAFAALIARRHLPDSLTIEHKCTIIEEVKGSEFLRRLKIVAKRKKRAYRWDPERGHGSHGTVYLDGEYAVVKDLKKDSALGCWPTCASSSA